MMDDRTYIEDGSFAFPTVEGMEMTVVHNSLLEERKFVHDTMMCVYEGKLYMAWYSCPNGEIVDDTMIIGKSSADNGKSWSDAFIIAKDDGSCGEVRHYVPVSFLIDRGRLYAIISKMTRHDRPISTGLYRMECKDGIENWQHVADIVSEADDRSLIVNNNAVALPNGGYILSGRYHPQKNQYPDRPCVLLCTDGNIEKWRLLPLTQEPLGACPETSVTLAANGKLIALTRISSAGQKSVFFVSEDNGETWERIENSLPVVASKLYLYSFSNQKTVAAFNCASDGKTRKRLCLGVLNPQNMQWEGIRTLAFGETEVGDVYHYPCILENQGMVLVSCTVNRGTVRSAAVFRMELSKI